MSYIYTMDFHLAIKKNETMSLMGKWRQLEIIILGKNKPD